MSLNLQESPLINLLGQTSSLPWQLVGISSYESIISYCNSHYPPSVILAKDAGAELIVKLLKISAGFGASSDGHIHLVSWTNFGTSPCCSWLLWSSACVYYGIWKEFWMWFFFFSFSLIDFGFVWQDATLKCRAYIRQVVQFLSTLEQSGKITLAVLEQEMAKLLDDVVIFNPPGLCWGNGKLLVKVSKSFILLSGLMNICDDLIICITFKSPLWCFGDVYIGDILAQSKNMNLALKSCQEWQNQN